ncbi:hypothetical protein HHI36_013452 [Cryptolaemus montrouzieri]|uniref:Mos1 transposase HTH domain-containing protein n=1 Tax=Cryptolaemus montrouzieri TaxID=559131 RepID=A0ABD2NHC5_9CUCU
MSGFVPNNRHLREVLIFFFHSKKAAAEAHRGIPKVYGDAALSETTCQDWLRRSNFDFDVDDRPREGMPKIFENAEVPNARRVCFSLRSYVPGHFQAIACVGNDSKARNLGSL